MKNPFDRVRLPTTIEGFETLVAIICKKYRLKDAKHAAAVISIAIRHLPNDQAHTTYSHLGGSVLKNLANHVANHKGESIRHEAQVDQLKGMLESDPNNMQARDELVRAAGEGSTYAKSVLEKLGTLLGEPKGHVEEHI